MKDDWIMLSVKDKHGELMEITVRRRQVKEVIRIGSTYYVKIGNTKYMLTQPDCDLEVIYDDDSGTESGQ